MENEKEFYMSLYEKEHEQLVMALKKIDELEDGDYSCRTIEVDNKITNTIQIIYCKDCRFWDKSHISCEGLARCNTGESGIRYRGGHDFCSKGMLRGYYD